MRRIEVDEKAFDQFEKFRADEDETKALRELIRMGNRQKGDEADRIALVILEDHWFDYDENPGQASNAPFLEGLCRMVDAIRSYRLNFYDASSFERALEKAVHVPEKRIVLYIGAHGTKGRVGGANSANLMKKVAEFSRDKRKIEGVLLSSCSAAGHDPALINALEGSTNWIFGYTSNIDFLGSIQLETAILSAVLDAGHSYMDSEDKIVKAFATALGCFNPHWKIGEAPQSALWQSVRLVTRAKHKKNPTDCTEVLVEEAWPDWTFP